MTGRSAGRAARHVHHRYTRECGPNFGKTRGDQLVTTQKAFGIADFNHHVAVLGTLDGTVDDLAYAILEFIELALAFIFTHALHNNLLGRLRCNTTKVDRRQWINEMFANLNFRLKLTSNVNGDLRVLILHLLDSFRPAAETNFARLAVDGRANVLLVTILGAASLLNGLLHRFQHFFAVDVLLARDCVCDQQQFRADNRCVHQIGPPASMRRVIVSSSPASSDSVSEREASRRHSPLQV